MDLTVVGLKSMALISINATKAHRGRCPGICNALVKKVVYLRGFEVASSLRIQQYSKAQNREVAEHSQYLGAK